MNNVWPWLVGLSLILFVFRWAYNWRAQRRYMREYRRKNKEQSIKSLLKTWKRQDYNARESHELDALNYSLQARKQELKRQEKAYYDSLESEDCIGTVKVASGRMREVKVDEKKTADDYRPTLTQSEAKTAQGVKKAKEREYEGIRQDLERIGKEFGLSAEEMKAAYRKAESIVQEGKLK